MLLTGRRRFADDMGERPGTVSAAMAKRCSPVHHVPGAPSRSHPRSIWLASSERMGSFWRATSICDS